jgi:hypothetical protein
MTCFLVSIEWLFNSALSAFTHRTNVIELSTIRSDLLGGTRRYCELLRTNLTAGIQSYFRTSDLGSYFGLCDPDHISRSNCPDQPHAQ